MGLFNKKELSRIQFLEAQLATLGAMESVELENRLEQQRGQLVFLNAEIDKQRDLMIRIKHQIDLNNQELNFVEEEVNYTEFGFYRPKYNCVSSDEYKERLILCRNMQKQMVKNKTALSFSDNWQLDGSKSKGRAMNNDNMKMVIRAFNNECDVIIAKTKYNNIEKIKERINKVAKQIDKLNQRNKIFINQKYIDLKWQEVDLCFEYERKKQQEKEILREQREAEREEKKLQQELKEKRKDINKEKKHYQSHLEELEKKLLEADESEREYLESEINKAKEHLDEVEVSLKDLDYREVNKKAGYVYIISNEGAFGEDVYKIGMTRRLEPQERVDELGGASVPFKFCVHGMVFSDDAPQLENAMHKAFEQNRVNKINGRKEFFKVDLTEIENVLNQNYNKHVTLIRDVKNEEFARSESFKLN
jgi:hypothetical protein